MPKGQQLDSDFAAQLGQEFESRQKYLVAVSGGRDSVVLLHFLKNELGLKNLVVCHLDHGLRGEASTGDAEFVKNLAAELNCDFEIQTVDTQCIAEEQKLSIETAARDLRYEFFRDIARKHGCSRIFLAHHADDQVETILMRLFRGAGFRGLGGMRSMTERHVGQGRLILLRPFLQVWRDEIDRFASENGIPYREDATNAEPIALRNRMRNQVIPGISEAFERDVRENVLRLGEIATREHAWVEETLAAAADTLFWRKEERAIRIKILKELPEAVQFHAIESWLRESGISEAGFEDVERILNMALDSEAAAKINLTGNRFVRRRQGKLFLEE